VRNHLDTLCIPKSALPGGQTGNATDPSGDTQMGDDVDIMNGSPRVVDPIEEARADRLTKIRGILSGETSIQLTLQFLYSHNR
jgi:26S proteasome regulatory subunit N2